MIETTAIMIEDWRAIAIEQGKIIVRMAEALRLIANAHPDAPAIAREALNESQKINRGKHE